jgi:hypothetical protein
VSLLFIVIAFWLGGNVILATAIWSRYRRRCGREQVDAERRANTPSAGIGREGDESKQSPDRPEEHGRETMKATLL